MGVGSTSERKALDPKERQRAADCALRVSSHSQHSIVILFVLTIFSRDLCSIQLSYRLSLRVGVEPTTLGVNDDGNSVVASQANRVPRTQM